MCAAIATYSSDTLTATSIKELREELLNKYDLVDGKLLHKRSYRKARRGARAGTLSKKGYRRVGWKSKVLGTVIMLEHRVIYLMYYGTLPPLVDHIDRDKSNNRPENLRAADHILNNRNVGLSRNNKSGHKGVSWHKVAGKWRSCIEINRKQIHLGLFSDLGDAVKARKEAEEKYYKH